MTFSAKADYMWNFSNPQEFVIPAKAGIQSFVNSRTWTDWVPAVAGTTRLIEVSMGKLKHRRASQGNSGLKMASVLESGDSRRPGEGRQLSAAARA
jgi:hypothetical protein